jgi:ubiquinone/menaquinone biosynthesis C-methylase UbiE
MIQGVYDSSKRVGLLSLKSQDFKNVSIQDSESPNSKNLVIQISKHNHDYINELFSHISIEGTVIQDNSIIPVTEKVYQHGKLKNGSDTIMYRLNVNKAQKTMYLIFSANSDLLDFNISSENDGDNDEIQNEFNENKIILDECCGIGLQGQTLRLIGYKGKLIGCDISEGMLNKAYHKGIYNDLFIQNMNEELLLYDNYFDMVINLGSMELLNVPFVLKSTYRILKNNGIFFVSFQWDNGTNSTEHQNIKGIKENEAKELLEKNGFKINNIEKCQNAFYTPKPNSEICELIPVPYLFINAYKI